MGKNAFLLNKINDDFEMLLTMFKDVTENERPPIMDLMADYFNSALQATLNGDPIAWMNFGISPELFWAMDIVPLVIDAVAGQTAALYPEGITRYVDSAHV